MERKLSNRSERAFEKTKNPKPLLRGLSRYKGIKASVLLSLTSLLGSVGCTSAPDSSEKDQQEIAQQSPEPEERSFSGKKAAQFERTDGEAWDLNEPIELNDLYGRPSGGTWTLSDARSNAIINRLEGDETVQDIPEFPIRLGMRFHPGENRHMSPLSNYDAINSSRISIDNAFAYGMYRLGEHNDLNDSQKYRTIAFIAQSIQMLAVSRLGHEFAHGFDDSVRKRRPVPFSDLLFAHAHHDHQVSTEDLIRSQAAGLNNSSWMALQYHQQAATRGNIVTALGFLITRNDALMQWGYGHLFHHGDPEKDHQRKVEQIQKFQNTRIDEGGEDTEELKEEFEQEERQPEEPLNPSIYQVTGHGDTVAYLKLLEILGHGDTHADKELAIILGSNAFTAYFWQSFFEIYNYLENGKQTHERWQIAPHVEWPVFSTFRLPSGYLSQVRLPFVLESNYLDRLTLIGGHDLDGIMGNLNTYQVGAEISGNILHERAQLRWNIASVLSFNRDNHRYQGNVLEAGLSFGNETIRFGISGKHHHNDPLSSEVFLQENGFSFELNTEIILGPGPKRKKRVIPQHPHPPRPEDLPPITWESHQDPRNRDTSNPAPWENNVLSKR
jgi:hypothetical protein